MLKRLFILSLLFALPQYTMVFADETTIEKTKTQGTYSNPLSEVFLLPVRLVTGVIGAPIGAVVGLFTGFVSGFAFPGGHSYKTETTTTTTNAE